MSDIKSKRYEIISNDGKTAVIRFHDSGRFKSYRVVELNAIQKMLQNGEEIHLDHCYIKDFSYQTLAGIDKKPLMKFYAAESFWDGNVDFIGAQFGEGNVSFSGAQFGEGDVSFSRAQFGEGDVDFSEAQFGEGDVDFSMAQFGDGAVDFSSAQFGDGNVDFSLAQFGDGAVDFSRAQFGEGYVIFIGAQFGEGDVYFFRAQFGEGNVNFSRAQFGEGNVYFSEAQFGEGNVYFREAQFGEGNVSFRGAQFGEGNVSFFGAQFGDGDVSFSEAQLGEGNVDFSEAQFGKGVYHFEDIDAADTSFSFENQIINSHIKLSFCDIKKLVFKYCTNHNVIEIKGIIDEQTGIPKENPIKALAFVGMINLGTIRLNWDEHKAALKNYPVHLQDLSNEELSEEFKMLKENYHNQGQYDWEDEAYVEFRNLYRKGLKKHPFRQFFLWLLSKVGRFGTHYASIAWTMLAVIIVWGILYAIPGLASIYPDGAVRHWWSPFYYSVITFFTVGYGDLSAQNGFTASCCALESFLGVFLMSYFSVAVVRKILR